MAWIVAVRMLSFIVITRSVAVYIHIISVPSCVGHPAPASALSTRETLCPHTQREHGTYMLHVHVVTRQHTLASPPARSLLPMHSAFSESLDARLLRCTAHATPPTRAAPVSAPRQSLGSTSLGRWSQDPTRAPHTHAHGYTVVTASPSSASACLRRDGR